MMILSKNRGFSSFWEISDVNLPCNYQEKMLINNSLSFIPPAQVCEIDGNKKIYFKVDGLSLLSNQYGRRQPDRENVKRLVEDLKNCIIEIGKYMLDPSGLVIELRYILYDMATGCHKFLYVPGMRRDFRDQMKNLFEEIMRIYDHKDREGVVYLYDLYSKFLVDNFTPQLFCGLISTDKEDKRQAASQDIKERVEEFYITSNDIENEIIRDEYERNVEKEKYISILKNPIYILGLAVIVIAVTVLFIIFGKASLKYSLLILLMFLSYVTIDILCRAKQQEEKVLEKPEEKNYQDIAEAKVEQSLEDIQLPESISGSYRQKMTEKEEYSVPLKRETTTVETTVLSIEGSNKGVSRLVPCDEADTEQIYLIEGETRVGRQSGVCDYCLRDSSVSRIHAVLEKIGNKVVVIDVGSTNGTFINDEKIEINVPREAECGDIISFAGIEYECC